jgi:hypothetical protein
VIVIAESKVNDCFLCVFINSLRPDDPDLHPYHLPIKPTELNCLNHDSFIDCCDPVEFMPHAIPTNVVGHISDDLRATIIDAIKDSPEVTSGLRRCYF